MLKKLMITTAIGGLMIGSAMAEGTPPAPPAASPSPPAASTPAPKADASSITSSADVKFVNAQRSDQWLASKFKGTDVLGVDNEKIGDVSDMLFDKEGKIEAFIVSVGGFLGIGAKDVAIGPSAFQVVAGDKSKNEIDKLKIALSKDQLKQATNFEAYKAPTTTGMAPRDGIQRPAGPASSVR